MVQGLPCAIDLFENVLGGGGPDEGFGCIVVFGEVVVMVASSSGTLLKAPRRMASLVISAKNRSTWFSQDAEVA